MYIPCLALESATTIRLVTLVNPSTPPLLLRTRDKITICIEIREGRRGEERGGRGETGWGRKPCFPHLGSHQL